jgi:RNA polymerase subunit RPABC4/transcription elongation factor Spt4
MRGMATRPWCSTCGTPYDGTRQFCERCGVFLGQASWAPRNAKACPNCGAVGRPDLTTCPRCHTSYATGFSDHWEGHVLVEPVPPEPLPPGPTGPAVEGTCPACGYRNPPGAIVCVRCRSRLVPETSAAACPACGFINVPGETFCMNCGRYLEWPNAVDTPIWPDEPSDVSPASLARSNDKSARPSGVPPQLPREDQT